MTKKEFGQSLDTVAAYGIAVKDLLFFLHEDRFGSTLKGVCGSDPAQGAVAWMDRNYNSTEATVLAASCLLDTICDILEDLGVSDVLEDRYPCGSVEEVAAWCREE